MRIAEYYGLKSSQVFVGVGSDDVLAMLFLTFFNSKKPILFPDITYSFYDVWAELCCAFRMSVSRWMRSLHIRNRRLLQGKRRSHFPESECADRCAAVFRE